MKAEAATAERKPKLIVEVVKYRIKNFMYKDTLCKMQRKAVCWLHSFRS